jgi:hypothetical protein
MPLHNLQEFIHFIKNNEEYNWENIMSSVPLGEKMSYIIHHEPFLEKRGRALCVWLQDETQIWLFVSGSVVREEAMPVKVGMKAI